MKIHYVSMLLVIVIVVIFGVEGRSGDGSPGIPKEWREMEEAGQYLVVDAEEEPKNVWKHPTLANGYLGTIFSSNLTHVSGVYSGLNVGSKNSPPSHRAHIPSTISISISNSVSIASALDLQSARFMRLSIFNTSDQEQIILKQTTYAHRKYPSLLIHDITSLNQTKISSIVTLNLTVNDNNLTSIDINFTMKDVSVLRLGHLNVKIPKPIVLFGSIRQTETNTSEVVSVAMCFTAVPKTVEMDLAIPNNTLQFISAIRTSLDSDDPVLDSVYDYYNATIQGSSLFASHASSWNSLWEKGGVELSPLHNSSSSSSSSLFLPGVVNASLYALLSNSRDDWCYGISPGGIATNAYNGHVFWDMETWMLPVMLIYHPSIAKCYLQYRTSRLTAAKEKSQSYHFQGLMFPWESAFTGVECCPYQDTEGRYEQHINSDIVFAIAQYYYVTKDWKWLSSSDNVSDLVFGVARFWQSRVELGSDGKYGIAEVQPPDESAGVVNDSVYTNFIAGVSLKFATWLGKQMNIPQNNSFPYPLWEKIASNIRILESKALGIHLEYDGYQGQMINQADVVLMQYPLGYPLNSNTTNKGSSIQTALNDLKYYYNKTRDNGYFTGDSSYAISALRLKEYINNTHDITTLGNISATQWEKSLLHVIKPFNVWNERVVGGNPHFITGAGTFLQSILFGYAGIEIQEERMVFRNPKLIPETSFVRLRSVNYIGNRFNVEYTVSEISFELLELGWKMLELEQINGQNDKKKTVGFTKVGAVITFGMLNNQTFVLRDSDS